MTTEFPSLTEEFNQISRELERSMTSDRMFLHDKSNQMLRAQAEQLKALKVGEKAPLFALPAEDGNVIHLEDILQRRLALLHFYRGSWCPYCRQEIRAYERSRRRFLDLNVEPIFISPDPVTASKTLKDSLKAGITFLSDTSSAVSSAYGVRIEINPVTKEAYEATGVIDFSCSSVPNWHLPTPATFIVAQDRTIIYAHVETDYRQRKDPVDLIIEIKGMLSATF